LKDYKGVDFKVDNRVKPVGKSSNYKYRLHCQIRDPIHSIKTKNCPGQCNHSYTYGRWKRNQNNIGQPDQNRTTIPTGTQTSAFVWAFFWFEILSQRDGCWLLFLSFAGN